MEWFNEPPRWDAGSNRIELMTGSKTDFWRKTHYGFIRDNGHVYGQPVNGDFVAEVKVIGAYAEVYDQAGLMVRLDETIWLKCGVELVDGIYYASAVMTHDYSDWSMVTLPGAPDALWLRITREGSTVNVMFSMDGETYTPLRMGHLTSATVFVGVMACSPTGEGFTATFEGFQIRPHTPTDAHT